jgi:sugar-specific transcriptional regulator TrmB
MNEFPLQTRQVLKMLGFSDTEMKILQSLFIHKKMSVREISRETSVSFDAVHYSLHGLETKNIISRRSEGGEDIIQICSDQSFIDWIEGQKQRNGSFYDDAKTSLQMHLTNIREASWKPNVQYFEGKKGIIDVYKDMIDVGQDICGWTDIQKIQETIGDYMEEFIAKRIEKKISSRAIMPKNPLNEEYAQKNQMRFVKFSDDLPINGEIRIYGDKVAVITFHQEKPVGFIFGGAIITSLFRAVFQDAWKTV